MRMILAVLAFCLVVGVARADKVSVVVAADGAEPKLVQPFAVDFDDSGNAYFVEMNGGDRLRKIDAAGKVTVLAGTGKKGTPEKTADAAKAEFNGMHNLTVAPGKLVYLADTFNNCVRLYAEDFGKVTLFAGTGKKGYAGDGGPAHEAEFSQPICIAMNADRSKLYVADIGNKRVRLIDLKAATIETFAGTGKAGVPKDGGVAKEQPLVDPRAVAVDAKGNVYILERSGHALRVVTTDGKIQTVAGTGKAGAGGDGGPALKAAMNGPKFVSLDTDGSVLIADTENHQIRRYRPDTQVMELVAGTGKKGGKFDADPTKVELSRPHGVSVHPKTGAIYIADSDNNRILKIER